ncbi:ESPR-type extended signal peptide-containing protein [Dyella kyungheensis]|uniref:YadA-like family protein n=1 Tax=Dyella kyungheensis TaxID=1242174 RepID=A0ABS2JW28_9GAMM|nr:ESPR-type extended signal peptide-containing protein [Dyella kyungheensis]MBM7122258.1 YadA-like family protein [Dyella kyungheensis]
MNAIYRIVWNAVTGRWVVASELAKGRKKGGSKRAAVGAVLAAGLLGSLAMSHAAFAANGGSLNLCAEDNTGAALGTSGTPTALGSCSANTYDWGLFSDSAPNGGTGGTNQTSLTGNKDGTMSFYAANGLKMLSTLNMSGQKITNLADGTAASDAVNFGQLQTVATQATNINRYFKSGGLNNGTDDAVNNGALAIGANSKSAQGTDIAIGPGAVATGISNPGNGSMAIGYAAQATAGASMAVGLGSVATGSSSMAVGRYAQTTGSYSTTLGGRSLAQAANSVALGTRSLADRANTVSVGAASSFTDASGTAQVASTRQIVNMGAGTQSNDAVNVSQLTPVVAALGGGAAIDATSGAVTGPSYALTNANSINGTSGAATDVGSAFGKVDAALGTLNTAVTQNTTNIAGNTASISNLDSRVTTNEGNISTINTNVSNIDARVTQNTNSISSLDGRVTNVEGSISNFTNQINNGSVGMVQQVSAGADLTVGKDTDGAAVDFADKSGNARTLKSVKAGVSDNDAVNMSQLNATNATVTQNTTDISSLDKRVTTNEGDIGTINTNVSNIDARVTQNTSSVSSLDGRVTNVEGSVSNITNQISNGELGLVKQDASSKTVSVAKDTGGAVVDISGTDGERKLKGVAEGDVSASSKDAVNGSQLFATNQQVAQNTAAIAGNTASIAGLSQSINNITTGGNGVKFFHANSAAADSVASGQESVAMGGGAQATAKQSVALGSGSVADRDNSVSVGSQGNKRQITHVKAGTADTDAVNVAQLKAAGVINGDGSANAAVTYDRNADGSAAHGSITLGNGQAASGTTIHNVAAGVGEMDAVNVGQLNAVVSQATSTSNAIASNDAGAPAAKATGAHSAAIGGGSVADRDNTVSVGSQGNERQITNVKAGTADTDAVNVAQMNQASSSATSSANSYTDQQVGNVAKQVAGMQQQMDDQFRNVNKRISGNNAMSTSMMTMAASLGGIETQNRFGAGTGFSNGAKAISVGYQRAISKRANITVGASVTGGDSSVGVGVGMGW